MNSIVKYKNDSIGKAKISSFGHFKNKAISTIIRLANLRHYLSKCFEEFKLVY